MGVMLEQMGLRVEADDANSVTTELVEAVQSALISILDEGAAELRKQFPTLTIRREVF